MWCQQVTEQDPNQGEEVAPGIWDTTFFCIFLLPHVRFAFSGTYKQPLDPSELPFQCFHECFGQLWLSLSHVERQHLAIPWSAGQGWALAPAGSFLNILQFKLDSQQTFTV